MQLHGITCNLANKTFLEILSKKDCSSTTPDNTSYTANNSRHLVLDAAKILYCQCSGLWSHLLSRYIPFYDDKIDVMSQIQLPRRMAWGWERGC